MKRNSGYVRTAREHRQNHDYLLAGEYYSIAGNSYLATSWDRIRTKEVGLLQKGGLLKSFVWQEYAATCYRLSDSTTREENRARQGILGLEDVRENLVEHPAWVGLAWELEADLRLIAGLSGWEQAYETALGHLQEVESACNESEILSWCTEPGFNETSLYVSTLAEGVGRDLELSKLWTKEGRPSLCKRVEYKREEFETLLDELDEQGEWKWTEHDLPTIEDDADGDGRLE